jgi:hypothetical protein
MRDPELHSFSAPLQLYRGFRCVELPREISASIAKEHRSVTDGAASGRGHIPVVGIANGIPFRSSLVPRGDGAHRLYLNGDIRKRGGIELGDDVEIELRHDLEERGMELPEDIAESLGDAGKLDWFHALTPALRREILGWIVAAKRPDTRAKRIAILIDRLEESGLRRR